MINEKQVEEIFKGSKSPPQKKIPPHPAKPDTAGNPRPQPEPQPSKNYSRLIYKVQ